MPEAPQACTPVIKVAQWLRAEARSARECARRTIEEDRARRLRMREVRLHELRRRGEWPPGGPRAGSPSTVPPGRKGGVQPRPVPPPLQVRSEAVTASQVVVRVAGELDVATVPVLAEALRFRLQAAEAGTELIVDLAGVTFVDARGLAVLLEAGEAARSSRIVFRTIGRPSCLARVTAVAGERPSALES